MRTTKLQPMPTPNTPFRRRLAGSVIAVSAAFALAACGDPVGSPEGSDTPPANQSPEQDSVAGDEPAEDAAFGTAELTDPDGNSVGQVTIMEAEGGVQFEVSAEGMEPGFYGFHVHEIGECEPDSAAPDDPSDTGDFMSAGSHIPGEDDAEHPEHAGDLPTLLVTEDGTGMMSVVTDRLDESLLLDDDGSAIMVHSDPDNFGNVPERYASDGPDEDTTSTGDAGDRLACGVVEG